MTVIRIHSDDRRRGRLPGRSRGRTISRSYWERLESSLRGAKVQDLAPGDRKALETAIRQLARLPTTLPRQIAANETRLRAIEEQVRSTVSTLSRITNRQLFGMLMPGVPLTRVPLPPTPSVSPLPMSAGIYFLWNAAQCVYLGQAIRLRDRVTTAHEQAEPHFTVSWLADRSRDTLALEELFFLWLLLPRCNRAGVD